MRWVFWLVLSMCIVSVVYADTPQPNQQQNNNNDSNKSSVAPNAQQLADKFFKDGRYQKLNKTTADLPEDVETVKSASSHD